MRALLAYDNTDVWLSIDGGPRERRRVLMAAVGNGRFFGGGMKICPEARLDDGVLDLVTVGDYSRMEVLGRIGHLYAGTHLELEDIEGTRVTRVVVEPVEADAADPHRARRRDPGSPPGDVRDPARRAARSGLTRVSVHARRSRLVGRAGKPTKERRMIRQVPVVRCHHRRSPVHGEVRPSDHRSTWWRPLPELVERGGYLVNQVAACGGCHYPARKWLVALPVSAPTRFLRRRPR